jgi:DNA polymerase III gamma/tau subunit
MRDAIKYLEQVSVLGTISLENVRQYLWVVGDQQLVDILATIKSGDFWTSLTQLESLYHTGVDLSVFAKQMLGYIDEHFAQDPPWMSSMAWLFGTIAGKLRYMPQPLLAYKIGIHQHITWSSTPISTTKPQHNTASVPVTATPPAQKTPTSASQATSSSVTKPKQAPAAKDNISPEQLKEFLIRNVEISAKSLVEKYVVIQEISDHDVKLLAINKMAEISLSKNSDALEKLVEDALWSPRKVTLSFMSKEDYFASLS